MLEELAGPGAFHLGCLGGLTRDQTDVRFALLGILLGPGVPLEGSWGVLSGCVASYVRLMVEC